MSEKDVVLLGKTRWERGMEQDFLPGLKRIRAEKNLLESGRRDQVTLPPTDYVTISRPTGHVTNQNHPHPLSC
jgi:hypothetical protein